MRHSFEKPILNPSCLAEPCADHGAMHVVREDGHAMQPRRVSPRPFALQTNFAAHVAVRAFEACGVVALNFFVSGSAFFD